MGQSSFYLQWLAAASWSGHRLDRDWCLTANAWTRERRVSLVHEAQKGTTTTVRGLNCRDRCCQFVCLVNFNSTWCKPPKRRQPIHENRKLRLHPFSQSIPRPGMAGGGGGWVGLKFTFRIFLGKKRKFNDLDLVDQ
jgi:hypothetical protein